MQGSTTSDEQVLNSLNAIEARRLQTDATFRSIIEIEAVARREKTERLRAARMQASTATQ